MSDIPIGSPPVPPGRHAAPGGWYPDPLDAGRERYWDGWQWSRNTRVSENPAARPGASPQPWPGGPAGPSSPSQPHPPQQPYPPQPYAGEQHPGQQYPGQPYPGQQYPGQQYPGQQYPGQYPGQQYGQQPAGTKAAFTADGVRLAGWWWRALAIILDGILVGVVAALAASPIYLAVFNRMAEYFRRLVEATNQGLPVPPQPPVETFISQSESLLVTAIAVAVEAVYILVFLRWRSATPGKLICGLRVVPVDQGRVTRLGWNAIIPRALVWLIGGVAGIFWVLRLLDVLFPLWQPKRQALHDLAAKTQVVKIR